jgi:hypothetical protein
MMQAMQNRQGPDTSRPKNSAFRSFLSLLFPKAADRGVSTTSNGNDLQQLTIEGFMLGNFASFEPAKLSRR